MTQHIFCVYDAKAEAYLAPFTASTPGLAERMFSDLINTNGHQFNRHPEDYTLYRVGTFDTHNAQLSPTELTPLANGLTLKASADEALPWEA